MHLISNSVDPTDVTTEERGGDTYLVAKSVPFVRAMNLSGGYVPESEIKQSANKWDVPLTVNHPRDDSGEPVSVNRKPETKIGMAENPTFDGTWIRVDMAVNADVGKAMGGEAADIVANLENGEAFDVSSQYLPEPLPSGEYDGEHRTNVEGIAKPDSIALLPNKRGVCSVQDGCGINPEMAANSAIRVPMTANAKHGEKMDASAEIKVPDKFRFDSEDAAMSKADEMDLDGIHTHGEGDDRIYMPGESHEELVSELGAEAMESNSLAEFGRRVLQMITDNGVDEPAESGTDQSVDEPTQTDTMDRDKYIDEIVANSPLTEESLSERCNDGLEAIHNDVMANAGTDDDTDESMTDNSEVAELREEIAALREEMTANKRDEQEELATEIVANSAEYEDTESVLEHYPTKQALQAKKESLNSGATLPGTGATANTQFETDDDLDDIPSGVMN